MADAYKIYLKSYSEKKVRMPILPSELPEFSQSIDVEDFKAIKGGHYTIIDTKQQPTVSVEHLVPGQGKRLSFAVSRTTGEQILRILREAQNKKRPIKYIIAKQKGGYYLNRWFAVTSFSYHVDTKNDYVISFELTGWKKYKGWKK